MTSDMKFAIIAAGEGSRLAKEGITESKPLIKLHGVPIIERLVRIFVENGADSIGIIINEKQPDTLAKLTELKESYPIEIVIKDTPSSMHSMYELKELLKGDKFCLTTVDTIFKEEEFTRYIEEFKNCDADGIMAVTDYIDDEKPLYVDTDDNMEITAFRDTPGKESVYISGGIYGLTPRALDILDECMKQGVERMRNFQRKLIERGMRLKAYPFGKVIDIDHASDICKAEKFISEK